MLSWGSIIASLEEDYEPDRCCATNPDSLRVTNMKQLLGCVRTEVVKHC